MTPFEVTAGAIILIATTLTALGVIFTPVIKRFRDVSEWLEQFKRDWIGEVAGPGRDPVPGVMERLNKLDGELSQNSGKSTKDVVHKLLYKQEQMETKVDSLIEAFVEMGERLISIEHSLTKAPEDTKRTSAW